MDPNSLAQQEVYDRKCAGKEKFPSESAAREALKVYRKAGMLNHRSSGLSVYPCEFEDANHWHFGH